eukprot:TRINITY_DN331239_c0_g2_i2.p1 TRINITY_DN331239_c0_g2~~TRINITY_DN331239_c0_g2_i2.p1  ORF type:complete len:161 (+),score=19.02 TRINITY_DN331239_c0_g2_i2:130-612(+)
MMVQQNLFNLNPLTANRIISSALQIRYKLIQIDERAENYLMAQIEGSDDFLMPLDFESMRIRSANARSSIIARNFLSDPMDTPFSPMTLSRLSIQSSHCHSYYTATISRSRGTTSDSRRQMSRHDDGHRRARSVGARLGTQGQRSRSRNRGRILTSSSSN